VVLASISDNNSDPQPLTGLGVAKKPIFKLNPVGGGKILPTQRPKQMKKFLFFASALAGLFLTSSCQRENLEPEVNGGVTYEISLPTSPQTKGESGYDTYSLHYEVYKTADADKLADTPLLFDKTVEMTGNTTTVTLDLLNDQDYTVLFWANKKGTDYFDIADSRSDLKSVKVKQAASNNDDRDAFCGMDQIVNHDASQTKPVTLTRPFAQLNIATLVSTDDYDIAPQSSLVKLTSIPTAYNVFTGEPVGASTEVTYTVNLVPDGNLTVDGTAYKKVAMNYLLVPDSNISVYYEINTNNGTVKNTIDNVPVKKNYRTNIIGNLLTSNATYTVDIKPGFDESEYTVENGGNTSVKVKNVTEFTEAINDDNMDVIILGADIDLNEPLTRSVADPTYVVKSGKTLTVDLNGHKLSATSAQTGKNYEMFLVKGNLNVKNGTIEYEHKGENMLWSNMTCIFDVTAGGVLNLQGVTAKNLGGSDMGFVAHLNNWGEVTLNAENCTLESNYVAVRVFNSGYDMNNVDIKNSTLKGGNYAFWVHNYTEADFGSADKAEAHKALLNLKIYNQGNDLIGGVRYGMTNRVVADGNGITCNVSEDGSVVTLNTMSENGVVARYAAGAEKNNTVKEVVVGENIVSIPDRAFYRYFALETVTLPSTLTVLGANGEDYYTNGSIFQGCANLKNITIPESVNVLGPGVFYGCTSLTSINIPAGVTRIEKDTFRETGLTSIEFHEGVTYFGDYAFRDCEDLTEVIIKAPKFEVGSSTFLNAAGAVPSLTIYVANNEMKEYLEPKISANKQFKVVVPGLVSTVEDFNAALADKTQDVITLASGVTYEGTFNVKRDVKIVSENVASGAKAIIKGRVECVNTSATFSNVKFDYNDDSMNEFSSNIVGNPKGHPAIVGVYGGTTNIVEFDGCEFNCKSGYSLATAPGAVTHYGGAKLVMNDCILDCDGNPIYAKTNIEMTGCTVKMFGNNAVLSLNYSNEGRTVIFKNNTIENKSTNGAKTYGMQMLSTNGKAYKNMYFDIQGNTVDVMFAIGSSYTFENVTYATGSLEIGL